MQQLCPYLYRRIKESRGNGITTVIVPAFKIKIGETMTEGVSVYTREMCCNNDCTRLGRGDKTTEGHHLLRLQFIMRQHTEQSSRQETGGGVYKALLHYLRIRLCIEYEPLVYLFIHFGWLVVFMDIYICMGIYIYVNVYTYIYIYGYVICSYLFIFSFVCFCYFINYYLVIRQEVIVVLIHTSPVGGGNAPDS